MKRWMERLLSNKFFRIALVCVIVMFLISFCNIAFLMLAGPGMTAETRSVWMAVFEIIIMFMGIVAMISIIIWGIRLIIYRDEDKHDKAYWEDTESGKER